MEPSKLIDIYEHLFAEPGWKELVDDLNEKRENIKNAMAESNWNFDQIQFYRGLMSGYKYITGLEALVDQAKRDQQGLPDVDSASAES